MSKLEEILFQAEELGIRQEVIDYSVELREINPKLDRTDSMEVAYSLIKNAMGDE